MSLLFNREPVDDILQDPETPDKLKLSLQHAKSIRQYASEKLALPENKSYLYYVDLKRPYVVWNVFAAPEFSLKPTNWCYPIVGCVSYRGYFAQENAENEANLLKLKNLDVHVAGISAYSTLGWFNDPLMNTMLHWKQRSLAGLIFHELSHQLIYIKNETGFNEAFSSAIERLGTIQWILETDPNQLEEYLIYLRAQSDFRDLLLVTRTHLETLYESEITADQKRELKQKIINQMKLDYKSLKKQWPENTHFDSWFKKPINNARLTSTMTYLRDIPAFYQIFKEEKGEWSNFYKRIISLDNYNKKERDELIKKKRTNNIDYTDLVNLIKTNLKR